MEQLKSLGVRLALDDFGTGVSSLTDLAYAPFDILKMDQQLLAPERAAFAEAIIVMAHKLGITVAGEGAETQASVAFLERCSCDQAQGYFFSYPLSAKAFEAFAGSREFARIEA